MGRKILYTDNRKRQCLSRPTLGIIVRVLEEYTNVEKHTSGSYTVYLFRIAHAEVILIWILNDWIFLSLILVFNEIVYKNVELIENKWKKNKR